LRDVGVVVRSGYGAAGSPIALAAAMAGIPVVGFCLSDLPGVGGDADAFDVEGVVRSVMAFTADPQSAVAEGRRQAAAVSHLNVDAFVETLRRALLVEAP
jgi:hypothetical protein